MDGTERGADGEMKKRVESHVSPFTHSKTKL